jgi:hypothetical protein
MKYKRIALPPLILLILLFPFPEFAFTATVDIGGQTINIPSPPGFSEISSISPETVNLVQDLVLSTNRLLAVYLSQEDVGKIMQGEPALFEEYMTVMCVRKIERKNYSKREFEELQKIFKAEQETIYQKNKDLIETFLSSTSKSWSKKFEENIDLKLGGTVPLGIDSETPFSITMSTLSKYKVAQEGRVIKFVKVSRIMIYPPRRVG